MSEVATFRLPLSTNQTVYQDVPQQQQQQQVSSKKRAAPVSQSAAYAAAGGTQSHFKPPNAHQVFLDPTGSFVLSSDSTRDAIHVYAINGMNGKLRVCPSLHMANGSGPYFGAFGSAFAGTAQGISSSLSNSTAGTMLYVTSKTAGIFSTFSVSYTSTGCLGFELRQTLVPYPHEQLPRGATLGEVRVAAAFVYVAIENDHGFSPSDSMATLARGQSGAVAFRTLSSAYGRAPRTFAVNRAGDLLAIGNQASSNVAVVRRDPRSGLLGRAVGSLQVGLPGKPGAAQGLSCLVWDE